MIILHHLNKSRSKRIIWLLEALKVEYVIKAYQRLPDTNLAPQALKEIHPLGKSPVIEIDGLILAESGAISEYLTDKFSHKELAPNRDSFAHAHYLQWMHFAESSAALPILLHYFLQIEEGKTYFLDGYAKQEVTLILDYLESHLSDKDWLLGEQFSTADIMLSFIIETSFALGLLKEYPVLLNYLKQLNSKPEAQIASRIEKEHDNSER